MCVSACTKPQKSSGPDQERNNQESWDVHVITYILSLCLTHLNIVFQVSFSIIDLDASPPHTHTDIYIYIYICIYSLIMLAKSTKVKDIYEMLALKLVQENLPSLTTKANELEWDRVQSNCFSNKF